MQRNSNEGSKGLGMLAIFVGGTLVGAAVTALLTPASGPETRRRIKDLASRTREQANRIPHALSRGKDAVRDELRGNHDPVSSRS
jgi:gas vesicle protein